MIGRTQQALNRLGQVAQLRRLTGVAGSQVYHEVSLRAFMRQFRPDEIVPGSGLIQGDRMVIIGTAAIDAAQWPAPPRRDDKLLIDGRLLNVQAVEIRHIGGVVERYDMVVRG